MTVPPMSFIEELSEGDLKVLAQLLSLPTSTQPSASWLQSQREILSTLPPTLLKPPGILAKISRHVPLTPDRANRCMTHKPLNPHLIRRIFLLITSECTTRLKSLISNSALPGDISAAIYRLQSLNSLWMSPLLYKTAFGSEARYPRIEGGCEACILAAVGGNRQILSDLRACIRGRTRRHHKRPRLVRLVEAWIECLEDADEVLENSRVLGREITSFKKSTQRAKREERRDAISGLKAKSTEEEGVSSLLSRIREETKSQRKGLEECLASDNLNGATLVSLSKDPFGEQLKDSDVVGSPSASRMPGPNPFEDDGAEDRDGNSVIENFINDYYSRQLMSATTTPHLQEQDIHPAFWGSISCPHHVPPPEEDEVSSSLFRASFNFDPRRNQTQRDSLVPISPRALSPDFSPRSYSPAANSVRLPANRGQQAGAPSPFMDSDSIYSSDAGPSSPPLDRGSLYSESIYSTDDPSPNSPRSFSRDSHVRDTSGRNTSERAQDYQSLIGIDEVLITPLEQAKSVLARLRAEDAENRLGTEKE